MVINTMDVEEYLFGVVGKEMGNTWPFEALKAQAVCSRTLLYYYKDISAKKKLPYDVTDTIYHQVYGGVFSENENIIKAVEETSSQVLAGQTDGNEYNIVPSFFHACCGGHTNSASDMWGNKYCLMEGVKDPYCSETPFFTWHRVFTKDDLKSITGLEISSIRVLNFNKSGRCSQIELQGTWGKRIIEADNLRMMTVNNSTTFASKKSLPSTMFTITCNGNEFIFDGKGYGHGVGLCQWGARRMAEQGKDYVEILKYYFPELKLITIQQFKTVKHNISLEKPQTGGRYDFSSTASSCLS
ncbi:MAG: SpoIID/LytB domain-containing protein [bacterium]|nr:SpoIID/LytB domain-containing protein [bacterium]